MNKKEAAKHYTKGAVKKIRESYEKYQVPVSAQTNATPADLVMEMVEKLNGLDGKDVLVVANYDVAVLIAFLKNMNSLQKLGNDYNFKSLTLLTDIVEIDPRFEDKFEVVLANLNEPAKIDMMGKKFDVVIGNPPYQKGKASIWQKFASLGLDLLNDEGAMVMIHPAAYRLKGSHNGIKTYFNRMKKYYVECLYLSNHQTGRKLFGDTAITTADWYVIRKEEANGRLTTVTDVEGNVDAIDITNAVGIPDDITFDKDVITTGDDCLTIVTETSEFHTQSKAEKLSDEESDVFKYPAVYSLTKDGPRMKWSSVKAVKQAYGPKIILANGMGKPVLDLDGTIGMTQFAYAIVADAPELEKIYSALCNEDCVNLIQTLCGSAGYHHYSKVGVAFLKSDFYNKFI